ncbi:MAG TPA: hypothetical protein VM143_16900 [Acidimicrobiales bacterium]|nr:hypothetical protein [Acidimicrobiales bacterium]
MRYFRTASLVAVGFGLVMFVLSAATPAAAATTLTVEAITWNVLGLDSNDVSVGPATYPVGGRVCNTGSEAATVSASFVWTSSSPAMSLEGPATIDLGLLPAGSCRDAYWNVTVARAASSYDATRGYVIEATSTDGASAATPTPRELFVERLVSQNRNSVNSITGPSAVTVGDEVTYVVDADTALAGFEQLESFLTLPSSIFQVLRVAVTYEKPVGATNDTVYADACGWDPIPTSPTYLTCIGPARYEGGKVGGALLSRVTVKVIGTGTAELASAIYDKSGSSYHYNTDFSVRPNLLVVTASAPATPTTTTLPVDMTAVPAAAPITTTTTTAAPTPTGARDPGSVSTGVATTGTSDTGALSLIGLSLLSVGMLALAGSRLERPAVATPFQRSLHDLRRSLHEHDAGAEAWLLMDALDRVAGSLQDR